MGLSLSQPLWGYFDNSKKLCRIMTYNVEWGFLELPKDINTDSCGHPIPQTSLAQNEHLKLISKNIGVMNPDICFLQEMGSLDAVKCVSKNLFDMFGSTYSVHYSNDEKGYQGVGLLIKSTFDTLCEVSNIPNFPLNRALGITMNILGEKYKIVGVHLKSLYDHNYKKDVSEQLAQIEAVSNWTNDTENVIICGDFNNTSESEPIKKMQSLGYTDILDKPTIYVPNITNSHNTEFHGKDSKESGSRIDYIFTTKSIISISGHIVNFTRENPKPSKTLRQETSDHLPILGIFSL